MPGVYLLKNNKKRIIYIGKATNLRKRLISYLNRDDPRNQILLSNTAELDIIITNSETEALTLEESLIKLHKPRYNVRLKDDKKFPYLKLTVNEDFPRILFTRDLRPDGSLIFGPYTNARALRRTRDALCRIFKLVSCNKDLTKHHPRPCLEYYLSRCSGPCVGKITKTDYQQLVRKAIQFLRGNSDELEKEIEKRMWDYAKEENFEAAKILRDQLLAIRRISQRQQVVTSDNVDRDVIGIARSRFNCVACLFRIRENRLVAKEIFHLKISAHTSNEEIAGAFIRLIYTHLSFIPDEIIISYQPQQWEVQENWFREKGFKVRLGSNKKESLRNLLRWAEKNAESELAKKVVKKRIPAAILELQELLKLPKPPRWIEAFDISNLQEKFAVGSSVAFYDGHPHKKKYRHYRIKRVKGQNDFAMIAEIVNRRIKDLNEEKRFPELLLIDGGKGQLSSARKVVSSLHLEIPVYALAKRSDELFDPKGKVVSLPINSRAVILLKRLRDEAHRFAIGYHRKVRKREMTRSELDRITGIGKARKLKILKYFGSIDALKKASEDEIAQVPGLGKKLARTIYEWFHT